MKKILIACAMVGSLISAPALSSSALTPAITLVAGILNQGIFPTSDAFTTNDDIVIPTGDGIELHANIFVPTANPDQLKPAVIFINSWALNEYEYLTEAARLAENGFIVLSYSTRGFGDSNGLIDTAGPKDMHDLSKVIDYLLAHYNVDPNAIGTAGISYGSGISLLGAAHDSRIKAIAALSTWGSLKEALYGNETPRMIWGELLNISADLLGRPDSIIRETWENVLANRNMDEVYAWTDLRSPINYVDTINRNGTKVYISQNFGDNLFQVNGVMDLFQRLTVEKHIDLQPGMHAGPEIVGMIGGGNTHTLNNMHRWFAKHLKGDRDAMNNQQPVQMKVKFTDRWEQFSDFPVPQARNKTWYLHPRSLLGNGDLSESAYNNRREVSTGINSLIDTIATTGIPLASEIFEQAKLPVTAPVALLARNHSVAFETSRLRQALSIRGNPSLTFTIKPKSSKAQVVAYLYDVNALGIGTLITHGPITLHNAVPNRAVTLDMELVTTAYDVKAGHRLMLVMDTKDILYAAPTKSVFSMDFLFGANNKAQLSIPTL